MPPDLSIALAQFDFVLGDLDGNTARVLELAGRARDESGCAAIVFPELALTGYPPEDLLLRSDFLDACDRALAKLAGKVRGIDVILGHPQRRDGKLFNCASLLRDGASVATYRKWHLPNYGVFDEKRYFVAGSEPCVVDIRGVPVGLTICEDVWEDGPIRAAREAGARLVLNLNASPFHMQKGHEREEVVARHAADNDVPVAYVNLVGGQDELVFDGASFVMNRRGELMQQFSAFQEQLCIAGFSLDGPVPEPLPGTIPASEPLEASVYHALELGVRDYVNKNGFPGVVIGLSGGIDSALTLAVAADALGPQRVRAVLMPSRYTAAMSVEDARAQCVAMGVECREISIEPTFAAFQQSLAESFAGLAPDATEENIQARCRGVLLMALSNKTGDIVLTTGNKSEMAVGYATLYGDMAGGFAVIKDVLKTLVYGLARWRNGVAPVIPERVLQRPPSAELAPDQMDQDSLPPYEVLDEILRLYIEEDRAAGEIVARGFDPATVNDVLWRVDRNEYKRRQAPLGVRITRRAFGRDRRYPITSRFKSRHIACPED
ncbi:MAG: NAD+ synthase [Gammaproteobacteria bacterium]|jgi:NAD+ synthase (glutamine-hydrolysing)|nr:NAD+ synthase [Gammaproteobacteria bacterium]